MTALQLIAAAVVGVLAVARATRLVTSDAYPPVEWLRLRWQGWTARHAPGWEPLLTCPFCAAPYITAVALTAAVWADIWTPDLHTLAGWWWLLAVWAAGSYAAAMVVVRDEPPPVEP